METEYILLQVTYTHRLFYSFYSGTILFSSFMRRGHICVSFADAAALLAKCRYTLQYTYPYAYYLESGSRKALVSCHDREIAALFSGTCV